MSKVGMKQQSTIAPYYFRNEEDKKLYKKYYRTTGMPWSEVVKKYGSRAAKRYYSQNGRSDKLTAVRF